MKEFIAAKARRFRSWLTGEAKSEIRAAQNIQWITRHLRVPLPSTVVSLQPSTINWVINEMIINNRQCIVELGAGTSTQIIAQCLNLISEGTDQRTFISIEEDDTWAKIVRDTIEKDGNGNFIEVHHVPRSEGPGGYWYDEVRLDAILQGHQPDLLIIDGPAIKRAKLTADRSRVFHFFKERMSPTYCVFIDDTNRTAERELCEQWAKYARAPADYYNAYLGVVKKGVGFSSRPN